MAGAMDGGRIRASGLGLRFGGYQPGPLNAITDVAGVRVGHTTVIEGAGIRTGVTAVVPDALGRAGGALPAGLFVGNGFGKLVGATQVAELGVIETPVVLTATLSAFRAADALVTYMLALPGNENLLTVNPVVGETNDGYLSDIRARPITERHVLAAIAGARGGPVAEGSVGAGTGTAALGFKAGIGTASRLVRTAEQAGTGGPAGTGGTGGQAGIPGTIGVLVQSNFSGVLTVRGLPISPGGPGNPIGPCGPEPSAGEPPGNSCMIVVATDHALDARQLGRVARRAVFAMGRTGADFAGGSGDYAIAFATAGGPPAADSALGRVFAAAQDAVEEAILNSLFTATTVTGYQGRVGHAVPLDLVAATCREAGVLTLP